MGLSLNLRALGCIPNLRVVSGGVGGHEEILVVFFGGSSGPLEDSRGLLGSACGPLGRSSGPGEGSDAVRGLLVASRKWYWSLGRFSGSCRRC